MKIFKIIKKNLKLLMRSKTSALVIIFGPLMILLLVGLAFNNTRVSNLNVGTYSPSKTELTTTFIDTLKSNQNFAVVEYDTQEKCTGDIKQGKIHACIVFPENFVIENNKSNIITFYVDKSRTNFVYIIIDSVSSKINIQSTQLSYELTNDLLNVIQDTKSSNEENLLSIIKLKTSADDVSANLDTIKKTLNNLDLETGTIDTTALKDQADKILVDTTDLSDKANELVTTSQTFSDSVKNQWSGYNATLISSFNSDVNTFKTDIGNASALTTDDISRLISIANNISSDLTKIKSKLDNAKIAKTDILGKIASLQTEISDIRSDLDKLKASLEKLNGEINALKVTSAESIVNPITTKIEPVVSGTATNLNFMLPYLLILIIVFVSIMLSSTMIVMEKNSKAYFRNFTTPTKDLTFIIAAFLTNLFIVLLQIILILGLSYYFLNTSVVTANIPLALLLILVSIIMFTAIGMGIGYLFNSQEAATMAAISVGSVLLLISNLILPLESMAWYIQIAAKYNPYVIASEVLKKFMLFSVTFQDVMIQFLFLVGYSVAIFILILIIQRLTKFRYFSGIHKIKKAQKKDEIIDKYFRMHNGNLLRNEKDLLEELKMMSDATFKEYSAKDRDDFYEWMRKINKNTAVKMKGKSRQEMVEVLEKEVK